MRQIHCFALAITTALALAVFAHSGAVVLAEPTVDVAEESVTPADAKAALAVFNDLIGEWRGIGQPRRGSNRGAWRQQGEWVWDFSDDGTAISYQVDKGKLLKSARITYDPEAKSYQLDALSAEGDKRRYIGRRDGNKLVFETADAKGLAGHRITITKLNEKRTLVLHETQQPGQSTFFRVAEVGYTRAGTRLASSDQTGPQCIVTGGVGTTKVTYQGKTYYVCCSGCQQAFDDDPAGIIAEAKERLNAEKQP